MHKRVSLLLAFFLMAFTGLCIYTVFHWQDRVAFLAVHKLSKLGFQGTGPENISLQNGAIVLDTVHLDEKAYSKIKTVKIIPSWTTFIGHDRLHRLRIMNMHLTGELDKDGKISIAGLNNFTEENFESFISLAEQIYIANARLDLLSYHLGGLQFFFSGSIKKTGNYLSISGKLSSEQNQLTLDANVNGIVNPQLLSWELEMILEDGSLETDHFKLKRVYGQTAAAGQIWEAEYMNTNFTAGLMALFGYPAQSVSGAAIYKNGQFDLTAEGKYSTQPETMPIEISLNYQSNQPEIIPVSIYANTKKALMSYLKVNLQEPDFNKINLSLSIPYKKYGNKTIEVPFTISTSQHTINKKGTAVLRRLKSESKYEIKNINYSENK